MTVAQLIEILQQHPSEMPVTITGNRFMFRKLGEPYEPQVAHFHLVGQSFFLCNEDETDTIPCFECARGFSTIEVLEL